MSRVRWTGIGLVIALLAVAVTSCGPATLPCGTFTFTGSPHANRGINMTLNFAFDPVACGAPATNATTIAYVQIIRIIDQDTGAFLQPNSDQQNRIVTGQSASLNGWAIDRLSGRVWGYYGRNNDGTFSATLTTGSNTTDAILRDTPSGWPDNSWFDAVSVPVCLVGDATCQDRLIGYYFWLFIVDSAGVVSGNPLNYVARDWHRDAVDLSVTEWDNDAPGLGNNGFPAFSRMP